MELRHYWAAVRDGWRTIVASVVLTLVAAAAYVFVLPISYSSSTSMFVSTQVEGQNIEELSQRSAVAQQRVMSYAQVLNGNVLAEKVAQKVGGEFDLEDIDAVIVPGTVIIRVQVLDADPARARDIAAAYADLAPSTIQTLENSGAGGWQVEVRVVDDAELGEPAGARSPLVVLPLAVLFGLALGVAVAVLLWMVRRELAREDVSS